jgi:hypothetical protein
MARGWESKSVESQIDDQRIAREQRRGERTPDEMERERQRHSLELSRRRVVSELEATQSPVRRAALEHALKHLDGELAKL